MARNGYLAEDGIVLVTVEDDDQLIATAAASFFAMRAAAADDGVDLRIVEPAGAYRRAWVQNDMVDHPENYNLNPASTIGFSRYGQSHGWGNRFDANSAAVAWLLKNGPRFGWVQEYGSRDKNHFKHDGVTATGGGAGGYTPPITIPSPEEDTMTDFILYAQKELGPAATKKADGFDIEQEAMFYCEAPGAPAFPLSNFKAYNTDDGAVLAYGAFNAIRGKGPGGASASRWPVSPKQAAAYLKRFGVATSPTTSGGGATVPGGPIQVEVPDPAVWGAAAAKAFTEALPSFEASGGFAPKG